MDTTEWMVVTAGLVSIALVLWYFFGGGERAAAPKNKRDGQQRGRWLPVALLMLLSITLFEGRTEAQERESGPLQIKAMQVKLFMMSEGTFGDDLIATDQARIVWNVGVNATADRFLVIVQVVGPPIFREPLPRLVFTATQGRRVVLRQTARIFNGVGDGTYYAAFLVPTTGCDPVKLTARIPGRRKSATMTQLVNFQCGE